MADVDPPGDGQASQGQDRRCGQKPEDPANLGGRLRGKHLSRMERAKKPVQEESPQEKIRHRASDRKRRDPVDETFSNPFIGSHTPDGQKQDPEAEERKELVTIFLLDSLPAGKGVSQ